MPVEIDFDFIAGEFGRIREAIQEIKQPRPIYRHAIAAGFVAASPSVLVVSNPVPPGRFFEITGVGAYTVNATDSLPDLHTAVASTYVDCYAGPSVGTESPGDVASGVGTFAIGSTTWLGDKKAFAMQGDKLYAWIYGITESTPVIVTFSIFDWRVEDRLEMSI